MKHFELLPREDPDESSSLQSENQWNVWVRILATSAPYQRYLKDPKTSWRLLGAAMALVAVCTILAVGSGKSSVSTAPGPVAIPDQPKQFYRHYDGDLHLHEVLKKSGFSKKGYHCEFCSDLSGDGRRMVVAQDSHVVILDYSDLEQEWKHTAALPCQPSPVLSISRNGKRLAMTHVEKGPAKMHKVQEVWVYDLTLDPPQKIHEQALDIEHPFYTNYTSPEKDIRVFPYKPDGRNADFGASLKLNDDGTILAIGLPLLIYSYHFQGAEKGPFVMGSIRVVQWDQTTRAWKPMGSEIDSLSMSSEETKNSNGTIMYIGQEIGHFIGLSSNGHRLVTTVNARLFPGAGPKATRDGIVVFEWDSAAQQWTQMQPILPVSERQYVTMSEDGNTLATEAAENQVRTFAFDSRTQQWLPFGAVQVGKTIGFKRFGTYGSRSMALSSTGKVLAVAVSGGIHEHNFPTSKIPTSHGYLQVFQYQHHAADANNQWVSMGAPVGPAHSGDNVMEDACSDFSSVMISSDGKHLVGQAPCPQLVQIFEYIDGGDNVVLDHAHMNN
ncbi:expressed unknown protein [Seminavis robusta]|uniref:Uncharacterized protein n=1 Tax=Seminavis robusta TaxID=568900 RepID=A0A9N8EKF0_9STRA|nr:expressed unknown protein [Seminavis robusta]|eukprot:Sro1255_g256480.1 n/a (554) ;mRNA; r:9625-11286